jgi:hypothetical protein
MEIKKLKDQIGDWRKGKKGRTQALPNDISREVAEYAHQTSLSRAAKELTLSNGTVWRAMKRAGKPTARRPAKRQPVAAAGSSSMLVAMPTDPNQNLTLKNTQGEVLTLPFTTESLVAALKYFFRI